MQKCEAKSRSYFAPVIYACRCVHNDDALPLRFSMTGILRVCEFVPAILKGKSGKHGFLKEIQTALQSVYFIIERLFEWEGTISFVM